jgi:hypothetical protein
MEPLECSSVGPATTLTNCPSSKIIRRTKDRLAFIKGLNRSPATILCGRRLLLGNGAFLTWLVTAIDLRLFGETFFEPITRARRQFR